MNASDLLEALEGLLRRRAAERAKTTVIDTRAIDALHMNMTRVAMMQHMHPLPGEPFPNYIQRLGCSWKAWLKCPKPGCEGKVGVFESEVDDIAGFKYHVRSCTACPGWQSSVEEPNKLPNDHTH